MGLSVSAPGGAYEDLTGGELRPVERLMQGEAGRIRYVTNIDIVGTKQPTALGVGVVKSKALKVDGVVIEKPRMYNAVFPSPIPANSPKFHLRVPNDVEVGLNAVTAHQQGQRGGGVLIAMPDSGWYRHPFFSAHNYNVQTPIAMVPNTDRSVDPQGHGTGESANIFALAPEATLQPIRASDDNGDLVAAQSGFLKAKELNPKIITCSWGGDSFPPPDAPPEADLVLAAEIQDALARGILVVFSAGNGQYSTEPQVPGVLAAGGVFMDAGGDLSASDYASGYQSTWFDKRIVPTVCGLVGMQPRAQYLMLPIPPGCSIDQIESKPDETDPTADGTSGADGWALFSGTSAAAPQLAGAAALLLGSKPTLTPAQVIEALTKTAVDVVVGRSFPQRYNNPAGPGPDLATGAGLINVAEALKYISDHF